MWPRAVLLAAALGPAVAAPAIAGVDRPAADWKVQAGKSFQRAGELVVRPTRSNYATLERAFSAYGKPEKCRVAGRPNHVVASWPSRGISIDAWTYGGMPEGEDGCISPDLIHVSEVRLTDKRWVTSLGLRVGDSTVKLRRLYPRSPYFEGGRGFRRNQYYLVWNHGPCVIGICSAYDLKYGIDTPQLTAEVKTGRVVALWLPVFAQGD
jgi:hypothetical protein